MALAELRRRDLEYEGPTPEPNHGSHSDVQSDSQAGAVAPPKGTSVPVLGSGRRPCHLPDQRPHMSACVTIQRWALVGHASLYITA